MLIQSTYDEFYRRGGWTYSHWRHKRFLRRRILEPLCIARGARILEVGCGRGVHSYLFYRLGHEVVGVDLSQGGIERARADFSGPRFLRLDAAFLAREFPAESFDLIYIRAMSWYHYELNAVNRFGIDVPARTAELFTLLRPDGVFVLQVVTDFSGREVNEVRYSRLAEYRRLFAPLGEIVLLTNERGQSLHDDAQAERLGGNVIIATRKRGAWRHPNT